MGLRNMVVCDVCDDEVTTVYCDSSYVMQPGWFRMINENGHKFDVCPSCHGVMSSHGNAVMTERRKLRNGAH